MTNRTRIISRVMDWIERQLVAWGQRVQTMRIDRVRKVMLAYARQTPEAWGDRAFRYVAIHPDESRAVLECSQIKNDMHRLVARRCLELAGVVSDASSGAR